MHQRLVGKYQKVYGIHIIGFPERGEQGVEESEWIFEELSEAMLWEPFRFDERHRVYWFSRPSECQTAVWRKLHLVML